MQLYPVLGQSYFELVLRWPPGEQSAPKRNTELRRRQMQIRHVGQWNVSWTGIGCEECHSAYGWRMDLAARHRETSCRVCGNSGGVLQVLCLLPMRSISPWHDESGSSLVRCTRGTELAGSTVIQRYKDTCHVSRIRCVIHHCGLIQPPMFNAKYAEEHHQIKANTQISLLTNPSHSRLPDQTLSDVLSTHTTPSRIH